MGRASCVCYNTKYGARCASSACWNRRRGIRGVGTAAHKTSSIWPTLVEQDSTWEVEGNMDGPRSYPPQLRINRHLRWIRGLSRPPTRTRMPSWGFMHEIMPTRELTNDDLEFVGSRKRYGRMEPRTGHQPVGAVCMLVGSYKYGALFLRPNIIDDADLHQLDHEEKTINEQARYPKASFGKQSFCHFSALGKGRTGVPCFSAKETGFVEHRE